MVGEDTILKKWKVKKTNPFVFANLYYDPKLYTHHIENQSLNEIYWANIIIIRSSYWYQTFPKMFIYIKTNKFQSSSLNWNNDEWNKNIFFEVDLWMF